MRRSEREIASRAEIDEIIAGSQVCRVAFAVNGEAYIVPLSFGYDGSALYFHTAREGKKIECIEANPEVCFELERNVRLLADTPEPCSWSFAFESVIGHGAVTELVSPEEKSAGLSLIIRHYGGGDSQSPLPSPGTLRVWRLDVRSVTGKRSVPRGRESGSEDGGACGGPVTGRKEEA
jgi:hypothetical protein